MNQVVVEALTALPPCSSMDTLLDFTGVECFSSLVHVSYPGCHVFVHVSGASRACARRTMNRIQVLDSSYDSKNKKNVGHLVSKSCCKTTFVHILKNIHITKRCLEFKIVNTTNQHKILHSTIVTSPSVQIGPQESAFHRIVVSLHMRAWLDTDDRTVHSFCTALLMSLKAGGTCILFHDISHSLVSSNMGVDTFDGEESEEEEFNSDHEKKSNKTTTKCIDTGSSASLSWMLALEMVGFASVEICFQRDGSFVLAARAPSHPTWDSWLCHKKPLYARSFHAQGHVLGRRNALGDRMDEYEEKVHAAAVPQAAARPTSITANRLGGHTNQSNNNLLSNSSSIGNGKIVRKWRLASTEQAADFKVPNSRLDFTDLFNGSVDEAMKAIEAGTVQIPTEGVYICSRSLSTQRERPVFFSIRRVKVSMEGSKVKNDIRSSDIADESPAASPAGVPQEQIAYVAARAADIEASIQKAEAARKVKAKVAKMMADNPEFAWGVEGEVISGNSTSGSKQSSQASTKAQEVKNLIVSGLKNLTGRLTLNAGTVENLRHVARSLKVFYTDCGVSKTKDQVLAIAQKFASRREVLFTSMEQKYRDQGLYKQLWRFKENLFGEEVLTLEEAEDAAERRNRRQAMFDAAQTRNEQNQSALKQVQSGSANNDGETDSSSDSSSESDVDLASLV